MDGQRASSAAQRSKVRFEMTTRASVTFPSLIKSSIVLID